LVRRRTRFSGMERNLGYLTARPGLGLDIIHFNLEGFYVWMQTT
jgi:hypothetical protein